MPIWKINFCSEHLQFLSDHDVTDCHVSVRMVGQVIRPRLQIIYPRKQEIVKVKAILDVTVLSLLGLAVSHA